MNAFRKAAAAAVQLLAAPLLALGAQAAHAAPVDDSTSDSGQTQQASAPTPSVSARSDASNITALQYLLSAWGVPTDADGSYGPKTTDSVTTYQKKKGLQVDGSAGPETMKSLTSTTGFPNSPNKNTTKAVQTLLSKVGYSLDIDGSFGPTTEKYVKAFQSKVGVSQTGKVDATTWAYLFGAKAAVGDWKKCSDSISGGIGKERTGVAKGNFRVASCLVPSVNAMVDAAARDGVTLSSNSSWRSRDEQIALRKKHCGTSEYAIYQMPASSCSPNTAKPGTSIHEYGLAIDVKNSGWGSAAHKWLRANGQKYGFKWTVSSEPWHFDTKQPAVG